MDEKDVQESESFCARLCEALFDAVASSRCLTASEKRVLGQLWAEGTVGTWMCENYPGHARFARKAKISPERLQSTLKRLEIKGFIKPSQGPEGTDKLRYLLNPLLVEDAYQRTKNGRRDSFKLVE